MNTQYCKFVGLIVSLVLLIPAVGVVSAKQQAGEPALLDKVVRGRFRAGAGEFLLKDLSLRAGVPLGFEMIAEDHASARTVTMDVRNPTVRDVLNAFVNSDPRYEWKVIDGVINVYPREVKEPLLDTAIGFHQIHAEDANEIVRQVMSLQELRQDAETLGIEIERLRTSYGGGQSCPVTISVQGGTLRSILNQLIANHCYRHWNAVRLGENGGPRRFSVAVY